MTVKANEWYRVKETHQYCQVQRLPSAKNPKISVPKADENTRGFEAALVWYAPVDEKLATWTKRVMIMDLKKALSLLREPGKEDLPLIKKIKSIANKIPIASASRDGEFTWRV
ncbi:MAG TPA: hypothetical protein VL354_09600 [Spirochaetia bacterium]|nr:hypothetical protein [Spirochaetia bacterium]